MTKNRINGSRKMMKSVSSPVTTAFNVTRVKILSTQYSVQTIDLTYH
jgi:hypothetical protein